MGSQTLGAPVIRIRPTGIGSGPADPDGWLWALTFGLSAAAAAWLIFRRAKRR